MTSSTEPEASGLDWTFGSYVFQAAFENLAVALRWMFWGLLLQLGGVAIAVAPLMAGLAGLAPLSAKLVIPGLIAMAAGGIVLIIGEQKCLHLELPLGMTKSLPGHAWLRAAYWCHLGSWLLRIARQFLNRGFVGVVLLPMQLLGFMFLLFFLRKTADVFARRDLKRLVDAIFVLAGATLLSGAFLAAEAFLNLNVLKMFPHFLAVAFLGMPVVLFLAVTGAYVVLLGRMASAAAAFATYLGQAAESQLIEDELASD